MQAQAAALRHVTLLSRLFRRLCCVTIRLGGKNILIALGNDFTGFDAERKVSRISDVLPWFQGAIHERYSMSKYDVERLGGTFTPHMAEIHDQ